jgi:hypothetical protein
MLALLQGQRPQNYQPTRLAVFASDLAHGAIAAPLEPLTAAPE